MSELQPDTDFSSINIGDTIPPFEIEETQERMNGGGSRLPWPEDFEPGVNLHNDADFAKKSLFGTTANGGVMTMAYINQMLEACFPIESLYNGGSLTYKGIKAFRHGDTVVFVGEVTGKRMENDKIFIDIEIKGIDKTGRLVGVASATVVNDS